MSSKENDLAKTPMHAWHAANGGKMVEFGGFDMPVQYASGIITEHLATRRGAGAFDVSHMGRFEVLGADAEAYLSKVLTNNVRALKSGEAQYTFIANENGGALDDAYLYKLAEAHYLLVVNASNRRKDWDWLTEQAGATKPDLRDSSETLAMISLQGPSAGAILEGMVDKRELPESKRNLLSTCKIAGNSVIVARTGYTGEPICFELFPPSDCAVELWERLIDAGAAPIGLGARDSLRLEAGLPLYGHELGLDRDGEDIPIFANSLAKFAVRTGEETSFIGGEALARQRDEFTKIQRGELDTPLAERRLKRLIRPVAVFEGRKPLRAGYRVFHADTEVGYVTSGTTVPYAQFDGGDLADRPSEEHGLRPIGLALVDSTLSYRVGKPIALRISDDRDNVVNAELVEKNLWSPGAYGRAYKGFEPRRATEKVALDDVDSLAGQLVLDAKANTEWRREKCINLIPSEQCTSGFVDALCTADPAARYNEHKALRGLGPNAPDVRYYKGTEFIMAKEEELKRALATFFKCKQVEPRVISGQMANDTVYDALLMFKNRYRRGLEPRRLGPVLVHDLNKGGHLSAQFLGALRNYVAIDPQTERPAIEHFPFQKDNPHAVDVEATKRLIAAKKPELIVFGRSVIIYTEPVREIADFVFDEFGRDNAMRPLIMYDGAHVLGLLGPAFQQPFAEGADIVTGSTHKSFFGPQRGVILGNIEDDSPFAPLWRQIESRAFPGHVSNHHLGTLLGLLGATYEMLKYKDEYPRQVIANAKSFAKGLAERGLTLEGDASVGYTETHQVLLRGARGEGESLSSLFEQNNIITNPQAFHDDVGFAAASGVRMGTPEMTRYGMQENDFAGLADLIAEIIGHAQEKPQGYWRPAVLKLRREFTQMRYCFDGRLAFLIDAAQSRS